MQRRIHQFNKFRLYKHTLYICLAYKIYIAYIIHIYVLTDVYKFFHVDLLITSLRTTLVTKSSFITQHMANEKGNEKKCTFQLSIFLRLYV